jgi:hypothetical protein
MVVDCFRAEPLERLAAARSEDDESLEARDSEDPLGEMPGRWEVR